MVVIFRIVAFPIISHFILIFQLNHPFRYAYRIEKKKISFLPLTQKLSAFLHRIFVFKDFCESAIYCCYQLRVFFFVLNLIRNGTRLS